MRESKTMKDRGVHNEDPVVQWKAFTAAAEHFERQRIAGNSGLAFAFTEGGLVEAIRTGKWYVAY
jgi:midasin (ATPase involved in ribosome maturation)